MNYQKNIANLCAFLKNSYEKNIHELMPDVYGVDHLLANNLTNLTIADEFMPTQLDTTSYDIFDCNDVAALIDAHNLDRRDSARHIVAKYVYPFLLFFGIIGNMVSFLAMTNKYKSEQRGPRKNFHAFSLCLAILCLADITILLVCGLHEYIEQVFDYSMRSSSVFACKFLYFACYFINSLVAYLFAYIAIDRWQAATRPIDYKQKQSGRRHRLQILAIFVYCSAMCGPFFTFPTIHAVHTIRNNDLANKCILDIHLFKELMLLDGVILSFVPFLVTSVFSVLTLIALFKERKALHTHKMRPQKAAACLKSSSKQQKVAISVSLIVNISSTKRISRLKLTLSLLMLTISYLVSTLPVFVIISLQFIAPYIRHGVHLENELAVANTIMYANNSFNILFFILFGKNLRKELLGRCVSLR